MELISNFKNLADDKRFIEDTREIIVNDLFMQPTENFFTIVPGVKGGQQVAAMKGFEYVTVKSAGCGGDGVSPTWPAFSQFWNPQLQEVKISYCYSDFENSYLQWGLNNGYQRKDLDGTTLALFIQDMITKAMLMDMQRIVLLADEDIEAQNILTNEASMAKFYNTIPKGLISTLQYLKTLPEFAENFVALSKNTGAMSSQLSLDAEYALNIYENVTDQYDFDGDILLSSNVLFKNYEKWVKRANGYGLQSNVDLTQRGVGNLSVNGENILPIVNYDRWKKDFVTGTAPNQTIHLPHFALFTRKEWLQVGVDEQAALQNLTLEYIGGKEETFWIKANYMLDFKMVNPYGLKAAL